MSNSFSVKLRQSQKLAHLHCGTDFYCGTVYRWVVSEKFRTSWSCCRLFDRQKSDYQSQPLDVTEQTFVQNLNAATAASLSSVQAMTPLGCMLPPPKPDMRQSPGSSAIGCANSLASSTASFRQQPPPMKVSAFTAQSVACGSVFALQSSFFIAHCGNGIRKAKVVKA